jgi:Integral membrane protein, interacts with FtsH
MEFNKQNIQSKVTSTETHVIDEGLRAYMLKVYNYMGSALLVTGIVALLTFKFAVLSLSPLQFTPLGNSLYSSGLAWVVMLAPLGVVLYMSFGIAKMSAAKAQTVFWIFAALMGLSLSSIFVVYTETSITRVFFITAGTFGAMSIYGYTTKRDLTKLGSFLMMGLIGIIIASIVNIFMKSTNDVFCKIYFLGVLIFWNG